LDIIAIERYLERLKHKRNGHSHIDDADIADYLERVKQEDEEKFFTHLDSLPLEKRAQILIEISIPYQIDFITEHDAKSLSDIIEVLESDDAVNLFQAIEKADQSKSEALFSLLKEETQEVIEKLMQYESDEAGSLMQIELFHVPSDKTITQTIEILAEQKQNGIGNVQSVYVTDEKGKFLKSIAIDDLIVEKTAQTLAQILDKFPTSYSVTPHDSIDTVINTITKYDLISIAVIDPRGYLLGRITHDDAVTAMQQSATKQMYNISKVNENEHIHESFGRTSKTRSIWLAVNLVNAIIASMVIGVFEEILSAIVALAVLMPIVANMAGTASVQTMTVMIRQMALGEINFDGLRPVFIKEFYIGIINGVIFGVLSALIAQLWFENMHVSVAIGASMFVSFVLASLLGTTIPIVLKRMGFDPAVASSVIVITLVDIIGFFSFLGFAEMIVM
jgi:magnesium transporter